MFTEGNLLTYIHGIQGRLSPIVLISKIFA